MLDKVRTQHRRKTADELGGLADGVVGILGDGEEDVGLGRVRMEATYKVDKVEPNGSTDGSLGSRVTSRNRSEKRCRRI